MSYIRSPWCVIMVLAEYRRCRADFKIKSTSCGLKPRNSSMFWASAERIMCPSLLPTHARTGLWVYRVIENGQRKTLFLLILDSLQPRNTVRFNRLMLAPVRSLARSCGPALQGQDFLFKRYRKFVDHVRLQLQHDFTCEHISLPLILFGGGDAADPLRFLYRAPGSRVHSVPQGTFALQSTNFSAPRHPTTYPASHTEMKLHAADGEN